MTVNFEELTRLVKEREDFLMLHPELREFQDEIEKDLDKASNNGYNRMVIANNLMLTKLVELNEKLKELKDALNTMH